MIALPDLTPQFALDYQRLDADVQRLRALTAKPVVVEPVVSALDLQTQRDLDECRNRLADFAGKARTAKSVLDQLLAEIRRAQTPVMPPPRPPSSAPAGPVAPVSASPNSRLSELEIIVERLEQSVREQDQLLMDGQSQLDTLASKLNEYQMKFLA